MHNHITKIDANGQPTEGDDYVALRAPIFNYETLQLEWRRWDRNYIEVDSFADAQEKASAVTLCGDVCRAPTLAEQLSIVDYTRYSPAISPLFNSPKSGRFWTSTVDAEDPSVYAWGVVCSLGGSGYSFQDNDGFVRAVCVSQ